MPGRVDRYTGCQNVFCRASRPAGLSGADGPSGDARGRDPDPIRCNQTDAASRWKRGGPRRRRWRNAMICPILSNASQDEQGNVTWNHHECIEGSCSFWAEEITDCGLRASGLVIIGRAKAAMSAQHEEGAEAGAPAGDPLFAPPKLTLDPGALEPVLAAIREAAPDPRATDAILEAIRQAAPDPRASDAILAAIREAAPDPRASDAILEAIREAAPDPRATDAILEAIRQAAPDPRATDAILEAIRQAAPDPRATDAILEAVERINASGQGHRIKAPGRCGCSRGAAQGHGARARWTDRDAQRGRAVGHHLGRGARGAGGRGDSRAAAIVRAGA